ncbi:MAG: hypothetical protein IPO07_08265 [Haliscomenobacter sp.]|nr:hypothetical protein [Haliscomenobacter sp.]MBK9488778.1 hypothetical protein [Haliscomenobacter sp.]
MIFYKNSTLNRGKHGDWIFCPESCRIMSTFIRTPPGKFLVFFADAGILLPITPSFPTGVPPWVSGFWPVRRNKGLLLHPTRPLFTFKANGWEVIDADKAYADKIYNEVPGTIPAGESLIWALAKQSGKFEKVLRYPAEDGEYEKPLMDKLGL